MKERDENGRFKKGWKGGPGKPKGSKDKFPRALGEKILFVANKLEEDGKDLYTLAQDKPEWFWEVFVKPMLPKDLMIRSIKGWDDLSDEEKAVLLAEAKNLVK